MLRCFGKKWRIAFLGVVLLGAALTAVFWNSMARSDDTTGTLIVHEWGTFTSFSGADGVQVPFYATDDDLPRFVYQGPMFKGDTAQLVSLETPVLYFYADQPMTASVDVVFPKGRMTEWYPQSSPSPRQWLRWDGLKILPGTDVALPTEPRPSRYYPARETDANPLQIETVSTDSAPADPMYFMALLRQLFGATERKTKRTEHEKFLFYRGVGDITVPFTLSSTGYGRVILKNTARASLDGCVLVNIQNGWVRFQEIGRLESGASVTIQQTIAESPLEQLGAVMVRSLVAAGLYDKEARAMVKTWESAWFGENGTRLLYLVPRHLTDELLPLRVQPEPSATVRVLVGRHDFLTYEREQEVTALVGQMETPPPLSRLPTYVSPSQNDAFQITPVSAQQQAIEKELAKLGRFQDAAVSVGVRRLAQQRSARTQ